MTLHWRQIGWLLLALLVASTAVADDQIGRLFSTPDDRAKLDTLRSGLVKKMVLSEPVGEGGKSGLQPAEPLYFNGLVRRSDGRMTLWVNGQRLDQSGGSDELTLHRRADRQNRVKLRLKKERRTIQLKPGQAWDPAVKQVVDHFRIEKKRPEPQQTSDMMESSLEPVMMDDS
jgi:hypothetical protein